MKWTKHTTAEPFLLRRSYYFGVRSYSCRGRFLGLDWSAKAEPVPYEKLDNPQTLNRHAYVANNPLSRVGADGHCDFSSKATLNTVCHKVSDLRLTDAYTKQLKNAECEICRKHGISQQSFYLWKTILLQREGWEVNAKRIYSLYVVFNQSHAKHPSRLAK